VGQENRHVEEVLIAEPALGELPRARLAKPREKLANECCELGVGERDVGLLAMPLQRHLIEDTLDELDGAPDLRVLRELLVRLSGDLDETFAVGLLRRQDVEEAREAIGTPRLKVAASIAQWRQVRVMHRVQRALFDVGAVEVASEPVPGDLLVSADARTEPDASLAVALGLRGEREGELALLLHAEAGEDGGDAQLLGDALAVGPAREVRQLRS
jgi:hypothetical protein